MSRYLLNMALRGAGLYPINSIRPRKGIFESGNAASPFSGSLQNEGISDGSDRYYYQAERTETEDRDASPRMVSSIEATPGTMIPETENTKTETEALRDVAHTPGPSPSPKLTLNSVKTAWDASPSSEESQPASHSTQQVIVSQRREERGSEKEIGRVHNLPTSVTRSKQHISSTPESGKRINIENTPGDSVVSRPSESKNAAEGFVRNKFIKNDLSTDTHMPSPHYRNALSSVQYDMKESQENTKPASVSQTEKIRIAPTGQVPYWKVGTVIKNAAILPDSRATVKVNIGKVEVRATQTQKHLSSPPPQATLRSGFGDYFLVRNYGFPEY